MSAMSKHRIKCALSTGDSIRWESRGVELMRDKLVDFELYSFTADDQLSLGVYWNVNHWRAYVGDIFLGDECKIHGEGETPQEAMANADKAASELARQLDPQASLRQPQLPWGYKVESHLFKERTEVVEIPPKGSGDCACLIEIQNNRGNPTIEFEECVFVNTVKYAIALHEFEHGKAGRDG